MKYPYYSPNFRLKDLFRSLTMSKNDAEKTIINYFSKLTGKKYILITNSCRTALYLAYKAIGETGEVITSPLTCKVAIDPIIESGNVPVYADIETGTLNINPGDIESRITPGSKYLQVIHLGGVSCDMDEIMRIAEKHNLYVIEDCAQSLGAKFKEGYTGSFGDIACFSLIKNAYGIGGGILATNHQEIYQIAHELQEHFPDSSKLLIIYRLFRNLVESYRRSVLGNLLYWLLMKIKGKKASYQKVEKQLEKISIAEIKVTSFQISRFNKMHYLRCEAGKLAYSHLKEKGLFVNHEYDPGKSSYTKFFVFHPEFETIPLLKILHSNGIEAMHLEHKSGSPYQEKLIDKDSAIENGLNQYLKVHDSLISLPLREDFNLADINNIISLLR